MNSTVVAALISALVAVGTSVFVGLMARPKTRAEANQLNTAASVSVSADTRAWAQTIIDQANTAVERAEHRADEAEEEAEAAHRDAAQARVEARTASERVDELEGMMIEAYGWWRRQTEELRTSGVAVLPLPPRLEALWQSMG